MGFVTASAILLGSVLLALTGSRLAFAEDLIQPVAFADTTTIALTGEPSQAQLVNNTASAWTIEKAAYLDVIDGVVASRDIAVTGPTTLAPGGSVVIEVGPAPGDVSEASGFLVVTASSGGDQVVARRAMAITPVAPLTLVPRVESWSASDQRPQPGWPTTTQALLLNGSSCGSLAAKPQKAYVTSGLDIAPLVYTCAPGSVSPAIDAAFLFDASGITEIGKYAGKATIGETSVALTYTRTQPLLFALVPLLIGLLLAVIQQADVTAVRPVKRAIERIDQIDVDAEKQQDEYERRVAYAPYRAYDLTTAVAPEVARLKTEVAALQPGWTRDPLLPLRGTKTDELDALVEEAAKLDATVKSWPDLADAFAKLGPAIPADGVMAPHLVDAARTLLAPTGVAATAKSLTIDEARQLIDGVPKLTHYLERLPELAELLTLLETPPAVLDARDADTWAEARRLARQARAEYATAKDVKALDQAKVDDLVTRAHALQRQLIAPPPAPAHRAEGALRGPIGGAVPGGLATPDFGMLGSVAGAIAAAWSYTSGRALDWTWLIVAVAIAIVTGLQVNYIDKAWGRPIDYLILFGWAFGTTAILTPLLTAIQGIVAPPLTLKAGDKEDAASSG